jgi:hypothetical protein
MTTLPVLSEPPAIAPAQPDDLPPFWSATTIIGTLDKPALVPWTAAKTAAAAIDGLDVWQSRLRHEGRAEAMQWLKGARFRKGPGERSATDLGTAVHKACEHKAIYGEFRPEDVADRELRPFLAQFDNFLDHFQPEYLAAEVTVFHRTWRYAGTADAFIRIGGVPLIADYKTTSEDYAHDGKLRTPYPEVALQLAAYRYAELAAVWRARQAEQFKRRYYLLSETEAALGVPVPEVDGGVAILLTPTRYAVHPVECGPDMHDVFGHLCDVAGGFALRPATDFVRNPLIAPHAFDAPTDPFEGLER